MMKTLGWLRSLIRVELRNIQKHLVRTLLIAALIGIPVAAVVCGINLTQVTEMTPEDRAVAKMGQADLLIPHVEKIDNLRAALPSGCILEPISAGQQTAIASGMKIDVNTHRLNIDGLANGLAVLVKGRSPLAPNEISITQALAASSKISFDNTLKGGSSYGTLEYENGTSYSVVGIFEIPEQLNQLGVLHPHVPNSFIGQVGCLIKLPAGADENAIATTLEIECIKRSTLLKPRVSDLSLTIFVIGFFALAEAALIVAAAFIVGIRRRQREIGLIASMGGSRFQIAVSILFSASLISLIASVAGLCCGIGTAWIIHPYLDGWNFRRNGPFEIDWHSHTVAIVMGVSTALVSALIPAIGAARMPVKTALSGRRPAPSGSFKWAYVGLTLILIGIGLLYSIPRLTGNPTGGDVNKLPVFCIIAGSISGMIGLGLCSSSLLHMLASYSSKLPLSPRLALRELGRFRTRNGPIVTAILAGMSLCVIFAVFHKSVRNLVNQSDSQYLSDNQILVTGASAAQAAKEISIELNGTAPAKITAATLNGSQLVAGKPNGMFGSNRIGVVGDAFLVAAGIKDTDGEIARALKNGKLIQLFASEDSQFIAPIYGRNSNRSIAELEVVKAIGSQNVGAIGYVVSHAAVQKNEWQELSRQNSSTKWLIRFSDPVDKAKFDKSAEIANTFPNTSVDGQVNYQANRSSILPLFLISFAAGLFVIAIATSLAAAEAKTDQQILCTVGAPPSVFRHQTAARSGFLASIGSALAIPAGLLPAYGMICIIPPLDFAIPWIEFGCILIGLPVIAYTMTWLTSSIQFRFPSQKQRRAQNS